MIKGRVARVLSETEVVLNVGEEQGVREHMEFVIYSESGPIADPESGEILGNLETVKARVTASHVMERMSRARTLTYETTVPGPFAGISIDLYGPRTQTRRHRLKIRKKGVTPVDEDDVVGEGDLVRMVKEPAE